MNSSEKRTVVYAADGAKVGVDGVKFSLDPGGALAIGIGDTTLALFAPGSWNYALVEEVEPPTVTTPPTPRVWNSLNDIPPGTEVMWPGCGDRHIHVLPDGRGWFVDPEEKPDIYTCGWLLSRAGVAGPFEEVLDD